VVAVAKPRGLPTLPGAGFMDTTLLARVRAAYPEARPMHRLGRETSGLVLFARTHEAAAAIQAAWRGHRVEKGYRALGQGTAGPDALVITAPIGPVPHPRLGTVQAASPLGKPALSRVRVLDRGGRGTLFEVWIETGRPHQVRIHLAWAGHPLVGDPLYGPGGMPLADDPGLPGDGGYFLHAERLRFRHPASGLPMELYAPPPPELADQENADPVQSSMASSSRSSRAR
jgi:23S rRNA pseudouridine1911/1915/1917 synthase